MSIDPKTLGRSVGAVMAAEMVLELVGNFVLQPMLGEGGGWLHGAAGQPVAVGLIVACGVAAGLLALAMAAALASHTAPQQPALARAYFGLTVITVAVVIVEMASYPALRQLSEAYQAARASGAPESLFEPARAALSGWRNGLHLTGKVLEGANVTVFFLLLAATRRVPRPWALAAAATGVLQMVGIGAALMGGEVIFGLLAPLALAFLGTMGLLLVRGFPALEPGPEAPVAGR